VKTRPFSISIRTVLVAGMLAIALVPVLLIGALGVHTIGKTVRGEAQSRVNHDLGIVAGAYRERLAQMARGVEEAARRVGQAHGGHADLLAALRRELDLTVLNLCDADGRPIAGSYPSANALIPISRDPVLRQALQGRAAWGTVLLEADRLRIEAGPAFQNAAVVHAGSESGDPVSRSALLWWAACPIIEETGRVTALIYGGRLLNFRHELVDQLRAMVFSEADYQGKPRGTVTLFSGDVRVATNVLTSAGARAVGTRVGGGPPGGPRSRRELYRRGARRGRVVPERLHPAARPGRPQGGHGLRRPAAGAL
jgi:two-component system NtrC family sensor kinase